MPRRTIVDPFSREPKEEYLDLNFFQETLEEILSYLMYYDGKHSKESIQNCHHLFRRTNPAIYQSDIVHEFYYRSIVITAKTILDLGKEDFIPFMETLKERLTTLDPENQLLDDKLNELHVLSLIHI